MSNLIPINNDNKVSGRELYDFLEMDKSNFARWAKTNIVENEFAEENSDFVRLVINEETPTGGKIQREDFQLTIPFAKKLCMISKSLKGETARNYFIAVESKLQSLSQPKTIEDLIIMQAQSVKELKVQVIQLTGTVTAIKDTVITHSEGNWRETINKMMNKIVDRVGGKKFQEIRSESYQLLESRARVDLETRLKNYRSRLLEAGSGKTKINNACKLDVIEQDAKVKEIYTGIVKEYTIKYVA